MTQRTLAEIMKLKSQRSIRVEVRYEGGGSKRMREWLGLGVHFRRQGKGELGARISRAFQHSFEAGMNRVVVVGSDSPALTAALIGRAFDSLHRNDLVIGPATDGGYYLIGLGHLVPQVFLDIPWGTSEVLLRTLAVAADIGLQPVLLDALDDVDRPEDLRVWGELQS
jgi:rSAM/selenodomain-associated transferase 1